MTKQRFRELIKAAGLTQSNACADLGIALSTASRWPADRVPPYAAAYALLMDRLTPNERERARLEMAA